MLYGTRGGFTNLVNLSFSGEFPPIILNVTVILLFKKGEKTGPQNNRTISLYPELN